MAVPRRPRHLLPVLCLLALVPAACRSPRPLSEAAAPAPPATEDAGSGTSAALARAGVSLADLPDLGEPMPGDVLPPDDGLLPSSLPEYVDGMDDPLPGLADGDSPGQPHAPGGWHRSGQAAIRAARAQDRPLVLWFANTQAGPLDDQIGAQVLSHPDVTATLADIAVGLRMDFGHEITRKSKYYQAFRKRYKITGYPTLMFLQPDGTEVSRQVGYSAGTAKARIENFSRAAKLAAEAWKTRKSDLKKAGFQVWTDASGRPFFAKALRRSTREAVLIDPFRRVFRVPLERFSHESLVDLLDGLPATPGPEE